MITRFYLATRLDQYEWASALAESLVANGWEITYDWMSAFREGRELSLSAIALAEVSGVAQADVLLLALPASIGAHVELGVALAAGRRVVIVHREPPEPHPYPCPFYRHPLVTELPLGAGVKDVIAAAMGVA